MAAILQTIFLCAYFVNEKFCILIKMSSHCVFKDPIHMRHQGRLVRYFKNMFVEDGTSHSINNRLCYFDYENMWIMWYLSGFIMHLIRLQTPKFSFNDPIMKYKYECFTRYIKARLITNAYNSDNVRYSRSGCDGIKWFLEVVKQISFEINISLRFLRDIING